MVDLNFDPGYILAGSFGIAVAAIVLEALLPPTIQPWWGARRGFRAEARTAVAVVPEGTASTGFKPPPAVEPVKTAEPAPTQPPTVERRVWQMPFIGKDRRATAQPTAIATTPEPPRQQNREQR
jgi:hypothetical protein